MSNLKVTSGVSSSTYGDGFYAHVGMILPFAGTTAPDGWLILDGSTFSSTDYPQLYTLLGNSTTLPDLRQKILLGYDSNVPSRTVGSNAGGGNHYHSISYPTSNPVNSAVFSTTYATQTGHGHSINYNGIDDDAQGNHGHNAAHNSSTNTLSNAGNYSQAAPTNAAVSTGNHSHSWGYGFTFAQSNAHSHTINAVNTTYLSPSHLHNYDSTITAGSIQSASTSYQIDSVYVNFIMKAG